MSKVSLYIGNKRGVAIYEDGTEPRSEWVETGIKLGQYEDVLGYLVTEEKSKLGQISPVVDGQDVSNLVGKVLTQIDATVTDPEQRKAQKNIFEQMIWEWFHSRNDALRDVK